VYGGMKKKTNMSNDILTFLSVNMSIFIWYSYLSKK